MSALFRRLHEAISRGYGGSASALSLYRVLIGFALLTGPVLPRVRFLADYDEIWWDPPPGLTSLFGGPLPVGVYAALEIALLAAVVAMTLGWYTRYSSLAVSALAILTSSMMFGFGKIDHTILVFVACGLMAFSGWGNRLSLDERAGRLAAERSWPAGYLGWLLGVAFLTAAVPKAVGGWLDPGSQAARSYLVRSIGELERDSLLGDTLMSWPTIFWELSDWATIALEAALIVAFLAPALFRLTLLVAMGFHIANWLILGISFDGLPPTYLLFFLVAIPATTTDRWVAALERVPGMLAGGAALAAAVLVFVDRSLLVAIGSFDALPLLWPCVLAAGFWLYREKDRQLLTL